MFRFVGTVPGTLGLVWPSFRPKSGPKSKISGRIIKSFPGPLSSAKPMPSGQTQTFGQGACSWAKLDLSLALLSSSPSPVVVVFVFVVTLVVTFVFVFVVSSSLMSRLGYLTV